jgi:uncharacterized protein YfaS (alpha-2-macroglobulin family)
MSNSPVAYPRRASQRFLFLILALIVAISSSCSFPAPGQPTPTPLPNIPPQPTLAPTSLAATAQPTAPRPQATPAVALPPALVETDPQPASEIGPKAALTFYFNQAMERGSVQAALQAQPAVVGSFQWIDDATLKFTPNQALPLNTDLAVSFSTQARAANGLPLAAPVAFNYRTAGGFSLVDQLPRPGSADVAPSSAVVATFSRPIVPLGADAKSLAPAFTLEPAAKGRAEWLNTSTYIFYPDPPLLGGTDYSVHMNTGLSAADGATWSADQKLADWKFKTAPPSLLSVAPDGKTDLLLNAALILTFNQSMDAASVQKNLTVKGPAGEDVPGKLTWNADGSELTFQPDGLLKRSTNYQVSLSGKAQASGGTPLGKDFTIGYTTVPDFGVRSSEPANNGTLVMYDVNGGVRVRFTSPLAAQDLAASFKFQPPAGDPYVSRISDNEVYISGIFAYRSTYTLTILPGIQDSWGQSLKEAAVIHFQTPAAQPALSLPALVGDGMAFLSPHETAFAAQATNLKTLRVSYAALSQADYARAASIYAYDRAQSFSAPRLISFEKKLSLPGDKSQKLDIPLNADGKPLPTGLYYYQLQSPELNVKTSQPLPTILLVVSRVHLTLKLSQNQLTAWAVNLDNNGPLAGASLAIFTSDKNGTLSQAGAIQTDAQGLAHLDYAFPVETYTPIYAVLGKPGDANFSLASTAWTTGVSSYEFGIPTNNRETFLHTYLYTDRPIYQPGQTVDFRAMLHQENNGRYAPANLKQVNLSVKGDTSRATGDRITIFKTTLPLSDYGTAAGSFQLPENATPGYYTIEIAEDPNTILSFEVADYRKPEVELTASFGAPELRAGQDIQAVLKTSYYFGAPAAGLNLSWSLYALPDAFPLPEGYQAGPLDTSWLLPRGFGTDFGFGLGTQIASGQARTGADGSAALSVAGQKLLDAIDETHTQRLTLEVTLQDEQELPLTTRTESTVHPADSYIGVRSDAWAGQAKAEAGFTVQTFDWKLAPLANRKMTAIFQKVVYKQKADWNWQSGTPPYTLETTKIGSTDFQVDAQGHARVAFTPPSAGTYQVEVSGDGAQTQLLFWVGGEGSAPWPVMPSQQIRLVTDATEYTPGQTAKLLIPNPLGDKTLALITVERARVMKTTVVSIPGSSLEWDLPIEDAFAPNVYVSVLLLNSTATSAPDFRTGYTEIKVSPAALQLQVDLGATPASAAPGGDVRLAIQVKDSAGKPVQGEFSLSLVDKAILALADPNALPILDAFYGRQPLGVSTSLALAVYGRPTQTAAAAPVGGRGGGGDFISATVRTNFQDTAYWSGTLVTDANGQAAVTAKLPDNLTTWVVTARGLNRDMRVGEGVKEMVVGKDLLIRPATPRFLVAGDRVQLAAVVNNNTAKAFSAQVALQAKGVQLETPAQASQTVELAANGRARVTWWAKVQDVDQVDLVFSAQGGGLQDATTPASGSLPVVKYSIPQTFATSGVVTEPGERLEVISAPRSFNPTGGELRLEMAPSLSAAVLAGLKALDTFPHDLAEPVLSRMLANLETYQALQKLGLDAAGLHDALNGVIQDSLSRLVAWQNNDGGWGWAPDQTSDVYLSAYMLFGLSEAVRAGVQVNATVLDKASSYLSASLAAPAPTTQASTLDRLAFQHFALQQAGHGQKSAAGLYDVRERLSPWARALLALTLSAQNSQDDRVRSLVSDLEAQALRSATGAHWETSVGAQLNQGTPVFTTALVSLALARLDPTAAVLTDAVRYLSANRRVNGIWASTYESTWVMLALTEVMSTTGELTGSFAYTASLNDKPLASGKAAGPQELTPVTTSVPLSSLNPSVPNALKIEHDLGAGRLYYRAFLQVDRPVEQVPVLNRGLSISRQVVLAGQDCAHQDCLAVTGTSLSSQRELEVHLTITLPQAMYHLVVEDFIPAGAEIVDSSLKTVPKGVQAGQNGVASLIQASNPFGSGWNWWLFGAPQIYADHIRWTAPYLAAGTYQLTYRLTPLQAGEFRVLPAHAYENYFPEVEGSSAGAIFTITP